MKVIAGLGNPGSHYRWSRHNIGFQVVDRLAEMNHLPVSTKRYRSIYGTGWIDSREVALFKPMTFMNLSGEALKKAVAFFRAGMEDLIVVHDDLDLPFGRLRIKQRGGDGGHQGVRSIIEALGANVFLRLKVGVGRPPQGMEASDFVLAPFDPIEKSQLDEILSRAAEALVVMLSEGADAAMNRYQKRLTRPSQSP